MDESRDAASAPVAAVKLTGRRFDAHGIPASALPEIVAFEELVREIAKVIFRVRHSRKRVPSGYDSLLTLRLTEVHDGSSTSILERPIDAQGDLFADVDDIGLIGDAQIADDLNRAREYITHLIDASVIGDPIPDIFYQVPLTLVKRVGQSLQNGEGLQVSERDDGRWQQRRTYNASTRNAVIGKFSATYSRPTTVVGYIERIFTSNKSCTLRTVDNNLVSIPYGDTEFHFEVDGDQDAAEQPDYIASGTGEYSSDGVLLRLRDVTEFRLVYDPTLLTEVQQTLRGFSLLPPGWIDGEYGAEPNEEALKVANYLANLLYEHSLLTKFVYPTPEGGVQFEWPAAHPGEVSLTLTPGESLAKVRVTDTRSGRSKVFQGNPLAVEFLPLISNALGRSLNGRN